MAVALAATLGTVNASCASSFSGFYAGLQAGLASTSGKLTTTDNATAANTLAAKVNVGEKSFVGGLFAGYGMGVGSCAYVGGELYANMDSLNKNVVEFTNVATARFKYKVAHKFGFGGKVRLGYTVSQQAMVFVGLGMEYGKTRISAENVDTTAAAVGKGVITKKNKSSFAFAPSVGMDMFLSKNLFLRGEYTYVVGLKAKATGAKYGLAAANTALDAKVNLNQQRFMLGLGYKF